MKLPQFVSILICNLFLLIVINLFLRKQIVSTGYDKLVKVWNFKPDVRPFTYKGHKKAITCVDFNPTGQLIATSSKDGTIKLWPNKVKPKF